MGHAGWLAVLAVASCGYPELPRLSGADAPGDMADVDAAAPPQYSSCMGLDLTCGPNGIGSCCEAETIPGGTFLRGYDAATDAYNDMTYPATVSPFTLDKYEVTVGRFRKFVEAGGGLGTQANPPATGSGAHPKLSSSGWDSAWNTSLKVDTAGLKSALRCDAAKQTWTDAPGLNENKPIDCVTWYEAMAFCIWDGGYLATEAEWSYAAMGGGQQRTYPWSNPANSVGIDCVHANYNVNNPAGTYCVNGTTGGANRVGSESPAGDGLWGHSDLSGNVWEWVLDWYVSAYPFPQTCIDCANLTASSDRVFLGGSFANPASALRTAYRAHLTSFTRISNLGFRCARTP